MKKILIIVGLFFFLIFMGLGSFAYTLYLQTNKDFNNLLNGEKFSKPTKIYAQNGQCIAIIGPQNRQIVTFNQIDLNMKKAILAAEDSRFYQHGPVSFRSILRAAFEDLIHGKVVQGGSTLTQQLVKNLYLTPKKTLYRKLKEAVLSYKISRHLTKNQILTLYLNTVYFGNGAYGIQMASKSYFNENADQLTIPQADMLAGLVQAPTLYDPYVNPSLAEKRTLYVLDRMYEDKFITKKQYWQAVHSKIVLRKQSSFYAYGYQYKDGYFIEHVKNWLVRHYGEEVVDKGGLKVYTTLNPKLQYYAYLAVKNGIARLTKNLKAPYYVVDVRKWLIEHYGKNPDLEADLISVDPKNGYVEALVGGVSYKKTQYDRAIQAQRQPGSAFKPIVYLTALEEGFTPLDKIDDEPVEYRYGNKVWAPQNYTLRFHGPITLEYALAHSVNVATVKLLDKIGIENVIANARKLGITEPIPHNLTIALGSSSVTLEQLSRVYCTIDNYGLKPKLIFIRKIYNKDNQLIYENNPKLVRVFPKDLGFILTKMLEKVVKEGTGVYAKALGRPIAAKTGTSNHARDNWFMGFTPQLVTGVWVGFDDYKPCGPYAVGATMALPIWLNYMQNALSGKPVENFPVPNHLPLIMSNFLFKKTHMQSG
ncbi:MAG: transglycosylase domain-containing protein [Desulfurella sp.]|uniref:transglycosylase domain-containing protein n=1 Tax=Desulfurella sp. TaxID=1962857 RepID=UPI003D0E3AA6